MLIMDTALNPILRPTRPADNTKADVTDLRETLLRLNVWPEAGDEFLALLPVSRWHAPPLTNEDNEWLSIVAQAALKGDDLGSNYPAFFQKLITNANLRQAFLDELTHRQPEHTPNGNNVMKQ